jgi:exopolysaccharide biosynthesis polyprenyl glycosylphosphotransferase
MFRTVNLYQFYLRIACNLLPLGSFLLAAYLRFVWFRGFATYDYDPSDYFGLLLLATVVWAIAADHYNVSSVEKLFVENTGALGALAACAVTYLVLLAAVFFYHQLTFSRVFIAISGIALLVLALLLRLLFRKVVTHGFGHTSSRRVLIVGSDSFARRAAARLSHAPVPHCQIVGFVRLPGQPAAGNGAVSYEFTDLAKPQGIDDIVIALPPERWSDIPKMTGFLDRLPVSVRLVVDLGRGLPIRNQMFRIGRMTLVDLAATPADEVYYLILKRSFDIVFSALALALTSPALLLVALAIRLNSEGPIFFAQERVGLNGQPFRMYKFRTMKCNDAREAETRWTTRSDSRCTRLGKLLRRTSIDELPQFFNVLKGDMSVVGPRPERPHFVRKFLAEVARYDRRHRLKVGITGWAQVNGLRGDTSIRRRLKYDLDYIQNWSLAFDLRIIGLTIWAAIFGKNAY